jgi:hypothetical protein
MGGAYEGRDAVVDFVVDPSLCDNLWFVDEGGNPSYAVTPLSPDYYTLSGNTIPYNGDSRGYVEVQFTPEFFTLPHATENYYVIPLRMTGVTGIDHILTGTPREGLSPKRQNSDGWDVLPKDYVLYCVKYINNWDANYIRRGEDLVTENGVTTKVVRKDFSLVNSDVDRYTINYVNANDEVCKINTKNLKQAIFPVSFKRANGASIACNLILTFNGNTCTISTDDADVVTTGSGEFIAKGTERSEYREYQWGSNNGDPVQRDILRLAYNVSFKKGKVIGQDDKGNDIVLNNDIDVTTGDTLVVRDRESNKRVWFTPKYDESFVPGN